MKNRNKIFDVNSEIKMSENHLENVEKHIEIEKSKIKEESTKINQISQQVEEIANQTKLQLPNSRVHIPLNDSIFKWDDLFFLNNNPLIVESKIQKEIFQTPDLLPKLNNIDIIVVSIAGVIASLLDYFIVKIPKDINYLGKFQQEGSGFTKWLRTVGVEESGKLKQPFKWLEDVCKVPYDTSTNKIFQTIGNAGLEGLNPRQHRLLSLGHDPLFGLIFGIFDIFNGSLTAIDTNGNLQVLKTFNSSPTDKIFAPFLWLGHIISDICTKMGISIPGWGFLQILQFGSLGNKNRTIADISRWMYLNGYDLRHFLTMAISTASIEIIVRAYHYLSILDEKEKLNNSNLISISSKEFHNIQFNLKLHKMLFLSHTIAASGNALKVFSYGGNPLSINFPQWIMFAKESIKIGKGLLRDKKAEQINRNRDKINEVWEEIEKIHIGELNLLKVDTSIYYDIYDNR